MEPINLADYRSKKSQEIIEKEKSDFQREYERVVESIRRINNLLKDLKNVVEKEKP